MLESAFGAGRPSKDNVITLCVGFDQAKAVAEGIGEHSNAAITRILAGCSPNWTEKLGQMINKKTFVLICWGVWAIAGLFTYLRKTQIENNSPAAPVVATQQLVQLRDNGRIYYLTKAQGDEISLEGPFVYAVLFFLVLQHIAAARANIRENGT